MNVKTRLGILMNSWIGMFGLGLAVASAVVFLGFIGADLLGMEVGPYAGLFACLALPALFVVGLLLMPIGYVRAARRMRGDLEPPLRRNVLIFALLTVFNLALVGVASFRAVHYVETDAFCGRTCHTVMQPEYAAFQVSPHARVGCVRCHVGPGVPGFVRAKFGGLRQLMEVTLGTYPRPIPSPAYGLRPARETCERCHWPEKFQGDRLRVIRRYDDDEASTERVTVLLVHVGGGGPGPGAGSGIHWHMNLANEVTYIATDEKRTTIPWIRLKDRQGKVTEYVASGTSLRPETIAGARRRVMDCIDCHNRPSHAFKVVEQAADDMILSRGLDRGLPFLKQQIVAALKQDYPTRSAAVQGIAESLDRYYRDHHPDEYKKMHGPLRAVIQASQESYASNVFPEMRVTWGSYPNHLGHEFSPGCFRCHDGDHKSPDGREIASDCGTCHTVLAAGEIDPPILKQMAGEAGQ
jgi:NapC/NirT cytochrome c family protein